MKAKEAENPPVEKPKPVAVVPKPTATKKKEPKPAAQEEGADGEEQFRGYKILPDGRKTSFFHHEMTDEERALIGYQEDGNLKPKQLSAEEAAALAKQQQDSKGASSVWAGNTWEDRKMNDWAESKLNELLASCTATVGEDTITVDSLEDFKGTASIYVKLGKKKHFYDLGFKLKWEIASLDINGSFEYVDIVKDDVDDGDVVPTVKGGSGDAARKLCKALEAEVLNAMRAFTSEFLEQ